MRRNINMLSAVGLAIGLTLGAATAFNQNVSAASVDLPAGYTKNAVIKWNQTGKASKALLNASRKGMKEDNDTDAGSDNAEVNATKLTADQQKELSIYTVDLINSARHQLGQQSWTYSKGAQKFANRVADEYYKNSKSCWDKDHYVAGIERAAKASGLNSTIGQVYEDEAALPISSSYHTNLRPMSVLKEQVYFNVKQMLFGGFAGSNSQMNDLSQYFEWEHAGDLLGCRTKNYDDKTKYFAVSFSGLKGDSSKVSVHMLSVGKRYILNYKKFNK